MPLVVANKWNISRYINNSDIRFKCYITVVTLLDSLILASLLDLQGEVKLILKLVEYVYRTITAKSNLDTQYHSAD